MPSTRWTGTGIPVSAIALGFADQPVGAHIGKTMMLAELTGLFHVIGAAESAQSIRTQAVVENLLQKATETSRKSTFSSLRTLYGLDPEVPLYRLLRHLWPVHAADQPLVAVLIGAARDPLLRSTIPLLANTPAGGPVRWLDFAAVLEQFFAARYTQASLKTTGQNIASTWTQAGLLHGKLHKVRALPAFGPAATTMALVLGHLCGLRGDSLFDSVWARVLTNDKAALHVAAQQAARASLLDYRRLGDVIEIGFGQLLASVGINDGQT